MKKKTSKGLAHYALGGEVEDIGEDPNPKKYRDPYYEANATLAFYKDQLNAKLKEKNPEGFAGYFKGLGDLRRKGDKDAVNKYIQDTPYNDYLTPDEVKTTLGEDNYKKYLSSLTGLQTYAAHQGEQTPLFGDLELTDDFSKMNYGRRFASLPVTPSIAVKKIDNGLPRNYKREYTYNPSTSAVDFTEEGDLQLRPDYLKPKMAAGTGAEGVGAATGGGMPWMQLAQEMPQLFDAIIGVAENNPNAYSKQPTMNAAAMKNMVTPYSNFAMGGVTGVEAEGNEILETPDGIMSRIQGPSHEQGGVDVNVPDGTKIFSDRLMLDGKTMQQRKLKRERSLQKLEKLLSKNPDDAMLKQTLDRTKQTTDAEEAKDMMMQKMAGQVYAPQQQEYAYGSGPGGVDPLFDRKLLMDSVNSGGWQDGIGYGYTGDVTGISTPPGFAPPNPPSYGYNGAVTARSIPPGFTPPATLPADARVNTGSGLSAGDIVGLSGTAFGAIAPLVNTINAARDSAPNINRFQGFGAEALDTNQNAQDILGSLRTNQLTDIDTASNSAYARNRNSAQSVNTLRALDIAATQGTEKAKVSANDSFARQMMGLLGQRAELENVQDNVVMRGASARDIEDKADKDNFYSNMAQNLTNLSQGVQNVGRNLNISKGNKDDLTLISQLSQYGLSFDEKGNLISTK